MLRSSKQLTRADAEAIAASGLGFLAEEPQKLSRFMALTGIDLDQLRSDAGSPPVLRAVLDHLLEDESLLLVFASGAGLQPEMIAEARNLLDDGAPANRRR